MNLKDKRTLVTGGGGFIGGHLVQRLVELGCDVRVFVKYNSRNDWGQVEQLPPHIKGKIKVLSGDLKDPDAIRLAAKDVDVIFHLAALISIPYSYVNPRDVVETNITGTLNVLMAAKDQGVKKMIHTSTSEVYGTAQYVPIDEKHPLKGQSPYSASKIGADKIAESFYLTYDLPVCTVRPFNTYGPRQSARAVIPTIITQALTRKELFLGSLHPTRDLTYVKDMVTAFIKMAESDKAVGEMINVGSNFEISVGDLAEKIISLTGKDVKIKTDKARTRPVRSEVERLLCDNSKANDILEWSPETTLEEGLKETIEWISDHLDFYKSEVYNI